MSAPLHSCEKNIWAPQPPGLLEAQVAYVEICVVCLYCVFLLVLFVCMPGPNQRHVISKGHTKLKHSQNTHQTHDISKKQTLKGITKPCMNTTLPKHNKACKGGTNQNIYNATLTSKTQTKIQTRHPTNTLTKHKPNTKTKHTPNHT